MVFKNADKELHVLLELVSILRHNFAWDELIALVRLLISGMLGVPWCCV